MHSLYQQILPSSGVDFATSLNLTPSTLESPFNVPVRHEFVSRVMCNLVVARSSLLRIFEVREEPAPVIQDEEKDRRSTVRRGTEAVEGEVEMDEQGDGYINIAKVT
jgi:cleavage and polyadenylation specificity factor subunit 1